MPNALHPKRRKRAGSIRAKREPLILLEVHNRLQLPLPMTPTDRTFSEYCPQRAGTTLSESAGGPLEIMKALTSRRMDSVGLSSEGRLGDQDGSRLGEDVSFFSTSEPPGIKG